MRWEQEYREICEVIDLAPESKIKRERLKKSIKKDLEEVGYFDYRIFPPTFRWNLCAARMRMGRFDNYDGWEFRSDWSITFQGWNGYKNPLPKWNGKPVKRLLVLGEQGIGDEILFASAIPELIVRLGHDAITFYTYPRLIPIMERSFRIKCLPRMTLSQYTEGDAVVALGDLFMFYRRDKSHFPQKPYLKPDPERVEYWKERLSEFKGEKIGVAWKARHGKIDPKRLIGKGAYINLQYLKHPDGKWEEPLPEGVVDLGLDPLSDLGDQFNLVSALDRVISVTQTVVHVCGSIGKKCDAIKPPRGTGEVHNVLWYYGQGGPMIPYGSVYVHNSISEYQRYLRGS